MNAKPHLSQVQKLDRLMSANFDDAAGHGPWVPLPEIQALGIANQGRRFQDLRPIYSRQGFAVENKIERGKDGVTRSWYRKVCTGYPQAEREPHPHQSPQIHKARKSPGAWQAHPVVPERSWADVVRERNEKLAAGRQEVFTLTP